MKKAFFFVITSLALSCINPRLESRQYNIDYLMDLIEAGNEEGIQQFFSQPKYVTKIKHIIEFTEIFRSKLGERFGYKPSYREAYDHLKANIHNMNFPKEQEQQLLAIFKEIAVQSEKAEKKGYQLNSITMDFKGSIENSDSDIPDEIAIAYNEALAGCLICIIPSPVSYAIGGAMISDAFRRTYDYLEKRNLQNGKDTPYDYSDNRSASEYNGSDQSYDRDSWDKEY